MIAFLMPTIMAVVGLPIAHRGWRLAFRLWLVVLAGAGIAACGIIIMGSAIDGGPESPTIISTGRYALAIYGQYGADGVIMGAEDSVRVVDRNHVQVGEATVALRPLVWPLC